MCQLNCTVVGSDTDNSFNSYLKANWHSAVVAGCASGTNLHGIAGFIASPNFPNNYPQYSRCVWNITVPSGYFIKVTFYHFQLEPNQYSPCYTGAAGARVTITNVATNNNYHPFMLCGQSLPHPVYSVGNFVQVIFTSLSNQYSGFNATYRAMTNESGTNYAIPIGHVTQYTKPLCIQRKLRLCSCLACLYRVMDARGKFGEHVRCVRIARGAVESNSSFLSALQPSQVHPWLHIHTGKSMSIFFYNIADKNAFWLTGKFS